MKKSFREFLFSNRSYMPIPFLIVALAFAHPSAAPFAAGFIFIVVGEAMRIWGVAYAGPLTRATGNVGAPELIVAGPFAHLRNPLYFGNIVMYVGVGILANALVPWLPLAALVYFAFQYYMIVTLEEEFLRKEFSEQFQEYVKNVPRFVPRISPYRSPAQARQKPDFKAAIRSERRTFQAMIVTILLFCIVWALR